MMLEEYIKNIIDSDKWDVENISGKFIIKQVVDCKNDHSIYKLKETASNWVLLHIKTKLKRYLPKSLLYEVKVEFINVPKPKLQIYTSGGENMLNFSDTHINIHKTHSKHLGAYVSWDTNNSNITNVGIV